MSLYLDQIEPGHPTSKPHYHIEATAKILQEKGGHNWVPLVVKVVGEDRYQVVANSFIYAVAERAGLERVWCVIADESSETAELAQALAGEKIPRINLSTASRDDIHSALQFLIGQPDSPLKTVKLAVATNRIREAHRQYWQSLDPVASLKIGITKGKKLDVLGEVFYLTPQPVPDQPLPEKTTDSNLLSKMSVAELRTMAKASGMTGISKMKKADLVKALSSKV